MALVDSILYAIVHTALVVFVPPVLLGVINRVKAVFAGRRGPPILQGWYDLARLFRKGSVFSTTTTWVFRAGPVVALATTLLAAEMIPLGTHRAPIAFTGDMILVAYLFALGRFLTVSAAMDTGSAFEGMGAAREASFAVFAEPALFLALLVLARGSASLSLSTMLGPAIAHSWARGGAAMVLAFATLAVVLLAETSRIPFDDPNTHLELTMIHEVMVLDHSGPTFGTALYAASMKLFLLGAIVVRVATPFQTGSPWADAALCVAGVFALAVAIGVVESTMARLRLLHVPRLLVAACLLSSFGMFLLSR